MPRFAIAFVLSGACGYEPRLLTSDVDAATGDGPRDTTTGDAPGPWTPAAMIAIASSPTGLDDPSLATDELELYFNIGNVIYVSTRTSITAGWSAPVSAPGLTTMTFSPCLAGNGLTLVGIDEFAHDIYTATRTTRAASWAMPAISSVLSSSQDDDGPAMTADGLTFVLDSTRDGERTLYMSKRFATTEAWPAPQRIVELDGAGTESRPSLTDNRLEIYFERGGDIWSASRTSPTAAFDAPSIVSFASTASNEQDPWISPDGRHLVWASDRGGALVLWESFRTP